MILTRILDEMVERLRKAGAQGSAVESQKPARPTDPARTPSGNVIALFEQADRSSRCWAHASMATSVCSNNGFT